MCSFLPAHPVIDSTSTPVITPPVSSLPSPPVPVISPPVSRIVRTSNPALRVSHIIQKHGQEMKTRANSESETSDDDDDDDTGVATSSSSSSIFHLFFIQYIIIIFTHLLFIIDYVGG